MCHTLLCDPKNARNAAIYFPIYTGQVNITKIIEILQKPMKVKHNVEGYVCYKRKFEYYQLQIAKVMKRKENYKGCEEKIRKKNLSSWKKKEINVI